MFVLSAAGFMATSTSGCVARRVDVGRAEADLEPADARQRARRRADLGREVGQGADVVAEDGGRPGELGPGELHAVAGIAGEADGDPLELLDRELRLPGGRHAPSGCLHALVRSRREVEQLLGERLGEVLDDVDLADDADQAAPRRRRSGRSGSGRSASARSRRGSSGRGRASAARSVISVSTGWVRSTWPPTMRAKMSRSVSTPTSRPDRLAHEHRIAGAGPLDGAQALGEARPGRDGHGLAAAEDAQPLVGQGRDATGDRALGEVGHARSVVRPCARRPADIVRGW